MLRPPSLLYWAGLARYGILLYPGSIARYHASLDGFYRSGGYRRSEGDESELIDRRSAQLARRDSLRPRRTSSISTTFALTRSEAEYLRERFITVANDSMLAWALQHPGRPEEGHGTVGAPSHRRSAGRVSDTSLLRLNASRS